MEHVNNLTWTITQTPNSNNFSALQLWCSQIYMTKTESQRQLALNTAAVFQESWVNLIWTTCATLRWNTKHKSLHLAPIVTFAKSENNRDRVYRVYLYVCVYMCVFLHCDCDMWQPEAVRAICCGFTVLWLTSIHHGKSNVSRQCSRDVLGGLKDRCRVHPAGQRRTCQEALTLCLKKKKDCKLPASCSGI